MLKDNIERDIEEIELMIYGLKAIDKNRILSSLIIHAFGRNDE
jgi:hypothetical protein